MIERVKTKVSTKTSSDTIFDKNHDVNQNNINIKIVQPPIDKPLKKKKRKYKKRIPKKVKDDFLNTLNEYSAEGGTDNTTSITDIKKLSEPEIIELTNQLKVKILALKTSKEQLALTAPSQQLSLTASKSQIASQPTNYSQMPPRQSAGFQRTSLPAIMEPPHSSLPAIEPRSSLVPPREIDNELDDDVSIPLKRLLPTKTNDNPLFEKPTIKFLSGLTESELSIVNDENSDSDTYNKLKDIYKKYFGDEYKPLQYLDENDQIHNLQSMLRIKNIELKRTKTTDPKFEDLPEETQYQKGLFDYKSCYTNRRTGSLNPCLGEYEDYLKKLIEKNDRKELEIQFRNARGREPTSTMTNISLAEQIIDLTEYVPTLENDNFYKYEAMKNKNIIKLPEEISIEDQKEIKFFEQDEDVPRLQDLYIKYFGKGLPYNPLRSSVGEQVFDLVSALNTKKKTQITELSIDVNEPTLREKTIEQNEVYLAYKITNISYNVDRPKQIDQLKYLSEFSNYQVLVYQDGSTIYFCSVGSRKGLLNNSQSREDWFQSDLAILFGLSTSSFSGRFDSEKSILDNVISSTNPSVVIFCGHSLGGAISNELFLESLKSQSSYQAFSITFNSGSGYPNDVESPFNEKYINSRVLQFHVNYDPLSATNTLGTVINLPANMLTFSHSLSNFDDYDWNPYGTFIEKGLMYTQPYNEPQPPPPPQTPIENLVEDERLGILQPFYERYYPNDIFTPLDDNRPSNAELYSMERLLFPTTAYPRQNPRYYLSEAFKKDYKTRYP